MDLLLSPASTGGTAANTHIAHSDDTYQTASTEQVFGFVVLTRTQVAPDSMNTLSAYQHLPPNWDSYGAEPPSERAIATARNVLKAVTILVSMTANSNAQPQHIAPLADGGIQLEWSSPQRDIAVQISPLGTLGYLYVDRTHNQELTREADDASQGMTLHMIAEVLLAS